MVKYFVYYEIFSQIKNKLLFYIVLSYKMEKYIINYNKITKKT